MNFGVCGEKNHRRLIEYTNNHIERWAVVSAVFTVLCGLGLYVWGIPESTVLRFFLAILAIGTLKIWIEIAVGDLFFIIIGGTMIAEKCETIIGYLPKSTNIGKTGKMLSATVKNPLCVAAGKICRLYNSLYFHGLGLTLYIIKKRWCE